LHNIKTPVWFIDGNHEDHEALKDFKQISNTYHIKRGTVMDLPTGERALFMGGAASIDREFRTPGFDWFPEEVISEKDIANLPDEPIDIVFSHTCPDCILKQVIKKRNGRSDFRDPSTTYLQVVLEKYSPPRWYFSHWHISGDFSYNGTKFTCLGVNEARDLHSN
jgi:hypothetical protein